MSKTKHIDNSGFPLQIGLAYAVSSTRKDWRVLYQEHGWAHESVGESGFIDLVLEDENRTLLLNIECKRVQNTTWQFLLPHRNGRDSTYRRHCKFWLTRRRNNGAYIYFDWIDSVIEPTTYESQYCVVAGQDPKSRPMIERVAANVIHSTEALAAEERQVTKSDPSANPTRIYVNVIVTTATLEVCKFDSANISLSDGKIGDDGVFEEVPFIRFRKQLSTRAYQPNAQTNEMHSIAAEKENTVFVVNATQLMTFLNQFEIDDSGFQDHVKRLTGD